MTGEFILQRTFDASRRLLWKAWTEEDRIVQWFGPVGYEMQVARMNLKPGGEFRYAMRGPDGEIMWGKWGIREVVAPERLVFASAFSDETGALQRHPAMPGWPLEVLGTLELTQDKGRTYLVLRSSPLNATEAEQRTFDASHAMMERGWKGTLDQLDRYVRFASQIA